MRTLCGAQADAVLGLLVWSHHQRTRGLALRPLGRLGDHAGGNIATDDVLRNDSQTGKPRPESCAVGRCKHALPLKFALCLVRLSLARYQT